MYFVHDLWTVSPALLPVCYHFCYKTAPLNYLYNTDLKAANPFMRSHETGRFVFQMNQHLLNSRDVGHCRGMLHGSFCPWTDGLQSAVATTPALWILNLYVREYLKIYISWFNNTEHKVDSLRKIEVSEIQKILCHKCYHHVYFKKKNLSSGYTEKFYEIWSSHSSEFLDCCLVNSDMVEAARWLPKSSRNSPCKVCSKDRCSMCLLYVNHLLDHT